MTTAQGYQHDVLYRRARALYTEATGNPRGWWQESVEVRDSFVADAVQHIADERAAELQGRLEEVITDHWDRNVGFNEVTCDCDPAKHMTRLEFRRHLLTLITTELGADG